MLPKRLYKIFLQMTINQSNANIMYITSIRHMKPISLTHRSDRDTASSAMRINSAFRTTATKLGHHFGPLAGLAQDVKGSGRVPALLGRLTGQGTGLALLLNPTHCTGSSPYDSSVPFRRVALALGAQLACRCSGTPV